MQDARAALTAFYRECLTVNPTTDVASTLDRILADTFVSKGSLDSKTKQQLIGQVQFFWKLIPDLKWEPQQMLHEGNHFVVRSRASGTPNGDFMGLPTNGSKSFDIMTIDVHTIENGQLTTVHHLEDWATAMKQLTA